MDPDPRPAATGLVGYLAPDGFAAELAHELGEAAAFHDRLALLPGPPRAAAWSENVWLEPVRIAIRSIADGAAQLRAIQRNWALLPTTLHRRAALIEARLPHVAARPIAFGDPVPTAPLGSWTLLDADTILAAARCTSPFPNGVVRFVEDKDGPPNRAYLKLWEALTLIGRRPGRGMRCLDLGASPGGWTWVLASLGADVVAVDKTALDPRVAAMAGVTVLRDSAFALRPRDIGRVDWLFSDVVCYPDRLYRLVVDWIESGVCRNFLCTIKFQGPTDFDAQARFAAIPGSRLLHLHHNKHELTWIRLAAPDA
ncbi:MAG: hypothetical protein FJX67_14455 [Alphaproteobacteria bacterium]|nr:hypothetical protein [Alphaproteobacteria bacterium]